jgi:hypothetical protein
MNRLVRSWMGPAVVVAVMLGCLPVRAQQPAAKDLHRKLAPGVLKTVDPQRQWAEAFSRHDMVELLAVEPPDAKFDWARNVTFRHDVWTLQFEFKPVRMIHVDVPQPSGRMRRKLIWYMVYSVTNRKIEEKTWYLVYNEQQEKLEEKVIAVDGAGGVAEPPPQYGWMHPLQSQEGTYQIQFLNKPIRFIPEFLLESHEFNKVYPDRVIPVAIGDPRGKGPIWLREDPNQRFYTSVQMCDAGKGPEGAVAVGETVWGVAMWEDIDPRIDRFSVYVRGLTNAYRWQDEEGAYRQGSPIGTGRRLSRKTLKLNFWRPGDRYFEHEREIRYGIPGQVDYEWVYR